MTVCSPLGVWPTEGAAGVVVARETKPACLPVPGLALVTNSPLDAQSSFYYIHPAVAGPPGECETGGTNGTLELRARIPSPFLARGTGPIMTPYFVYRARLVRYRIWTSGDPQDDSPALWRSESGRYDTSGNPVTDPDPSLGRPLPPPWELVARGIEDLQIEYSSGDPGVWGNGPPVSAIGDWNSLVRQVRITLSARATAANLQGQTEAGGAPDAIRGQLTTTVTPRAAFNELQMGKVIQ